MKVKMSPIPEPFGKNWILCAYGQEIDIGIDVSFMNKIGMGAQEIFKEIGTCRTYTDNGNKKLARLICRKIGLTRSNAKTFIYR